MVCWWIAPSHFLNQYWFKAPSYYHNQGRLIVMKILRNTFAYNFNGIVLETVLVIIKCISLLGLWWCNMASWNLVNIDSDNGLLLDSTKPLSELMLPFCFQWDVVVFTWAQFQYKHSGFQSLKYELKNYTFEITNTRSKGQGVKINVFQNGCDLSLGSLS